MGRNYGGRGGGFQGREQERHTGAQLTVSKIIINTIARAHIFFYVDMANRAIMPWKPATPNRQKS
jgi:hypothetical protein